MKLPLSKIEKAAYTKEDCSQLAGVYFDGTYFLASDGFIAARVEAELHPGDEELKSGLIGHDAVKGIRKSKRNILPGEIEPMSFPAQYIHEQLVDVPAEAPIIVLDAALLYNLANAICTPHRDKRLLVGLYLPLPYGKPVIIKAVGSEDAGIGLLMEHHNDASCNLRDALDKLRKVLVEGDPIDSALRAKLRHALVEG